MEWRRRPRRLLVPTSQGPPDAEFPRALPLAAITRGANETVEFHLNGRDEVLPVSRSYLHLFPEI